MRAKQPHEEGLSNPILFPVIIDHRDTTMSFERAGKTAYLYDVDCYLRASDRFCENRVVKRLPIEFK